MEFTVMVVWNAENAEKNTFTPKTDIHYVPKMLQQYLDQKLS